MMISDIQRMPLSYNLAKDEDEQNLFKAAPLLGSNMEAQTFVCSFLCAYLVSVIMMMILRAPS
jgi:hypothetical protein